jgi:hypothetical protein
VAKKKAVKKTAKKAAKKKNAPAKRASAKRPAKKKAKKIAPKRAIKSAKGKMKPGKKKPAAKKKVAKKATPKRAAPPKAAKKSKSKSKPKKKTSSAKLIADDRVAALEAQLAAMQTRLDEATGTSPDLSAVLNVLSPRMDELHMSQSELRTRQDNLRDHHNQSDAAGREWQQGVDETVARLAKVLATLQHTCPVHGSAGPADAPSGDPPMLAGDDGAAPSAATSESVTPGSTTSGSATPGDAGAVQGRYAELESRVDELLADTDRVKAQIHGFAEIQRILSEMKGEAAVAKQAFQQFLDQSQRRLESELKALVELRNTQTHELVKRVRDRAQKGIEQFEAFLKRNAKK